MVVMMMNVLCRFLVLDFRCRAGRFAVLGGRGRGDIVREGGEGGCEGGNFFPLVRDALLVV